MTAIAGFLSVGYNKNGEVILDHPYIQPDTNGAGRIVFSPQQARHLASLLVEKAAIADRVVAPPWQPTATFEARVEAALKAMWYHPDAEIGTSFWDKWVKNKPAMAAALRAADALSPPSPALPAEVAALVERARELAGQYAGIHAQGAGVFRWRDEAFALVRELAALGAPQQETGRDDGR